MDMHQANTDGAHERSPLPGEVQALHGLAQASRNFLCHIDRAVFQEDSKLVSPQTGERIAFAQPGSQQRTNMAQQLITGRVPARVINQLELIQIEKHQCVPALLAVQIFQHQLQAVFKFSSIGQPSERIVGRLP